MSSSANQFPDQVRVALLVLLLLGLGGCSFTPDPVDGAGMAQDSVAVEADSVTVEPPRASADPPSVSLSDSLADAIATLVLERMQALPRDTLVVRIDTARASVAADTAGARPVERIQQGIRNIGTRIIIALLITIVTYYLLSGLLWLLESVAEQSARRRLFFKRLIPIVRMLTWAFVIYFIIANVFQVDRNGLLAASAALGIGIGLAGQDVIKNILGGLIIIFDSPFQVGDKISVGGTYGEVKSIGLRSTRIVTLDDSLVSVPNSQIIDGQVSNANAGALDCQVVIDLFLPGWIDVALAKKIAYEAATNSRYVFLDKPVVVLVKDKFKETFLTHLVVKAYVLDNRYESLFASDVTETAKIGFREAGLLVPFFPGDHPTEAGR